MTTQSYLPGSYETAESSTPCSSMRGDVRVVVRDLGSGVLQQRDELQRRRLAQVADVRLVRDAEHEDPRALHRALRVVVERLRDERAAEVRHLLVHLAGELDELRVEAELARLPREVEGIDGDAVAAEARARAEAHVAERLGRGGVDDLPDVDPHPVAEDRELVDERDVDRAEDVLEQLRELGRLRAGELVHRVDRAPVEVGGPARALGRDPAEHLRRRLRRPVLAPRVDALRRHREEEALAHAEAASLLEDRLEQLARRAGPGRRLEHHELALAQHSGEPACGVLDDREVGLALARERCRQRDEDGVRLAELVVARRRVDEAALDERREPVARDVGDVRLAAVERGDDVLEDVDDAGRGSRPRRTWPREAGRRSRRRRPRRRNAGPQPRSARLAATRSAACPSP